ncbi:trypsin-like peptidase domain-containing protein [Streptomyces luteolifulvus]|uniref:trypsin-like peptidase domain-containing protein n=1 Tax=Streptomyces luteolifulvus TaxID=2615112 RepID=UPI0038B5F6A4
MVEPAGEPGRRGSGYRITGGTVGTACHVVAGAAVVRVRCNADTPEESTRDARVLAADGDLALLAVDRADELTPVRFGRVLERDAVIACTGLGFPRFTFRGDASGTYRDVCHLVGSAPVLSNRRSGTLEITVASPPEPDPDPARSAWEGMSGAPVFAAGRLVAVVNAHHALERRGQAGGTPYRRPVSPQRPRVPRHPRAAAPGRGHPRRPAAGEPVLGTGGAPGRGRVHRPPAPGRPGRRAGGAHRVLLGPGLLSVVAGGPVGRQACSGLVLRARPARRCAIRIRMQQTQAVRLAPAALR